MRRDDIMATFASHRADIDRFGVNSLAVFGSVARDEAGPDSDLDLLVDFKAPTTFDRYMDLKIFLEDLLGCRVDLVMVTALKPRLRPVVEREAVRVA